jgi:PAS domain S-box-containing protein
MIGRVPASASTPDFERFYELVPDLMGVVGFDGYLKSVNPAWTKTLGWPESDLLSQPWADFVVAEDLEPTRDEVAKLADPAQTTRDFVVRLKVRTGGVRAISFSAHGDVESGVLYAVGKDITERTAGEEMVRRSGERFRNLAESVSDAVISADVDGTITHWNAAAERLFGHTAAGAVGQPLEILMPERYRAPHGAGIARLREGGESRLLGGTVEIEGLRSDGTEVPVELSLGSHSAGGETVYTGVVRDATERRRVERFRAAQLSTTAALTARGSDEEVLANVHAGLGEAMGWKFGGLWRVDPAGETLKCVATWHQEAVSAPAFESMTHQAAFGRGEGLPGRAWQEGRGVRIADLGADENFARLQAAAADGFHGGVAVPVIAGEEFFGVMDFFHEAADTMDQEMVEAMFALAGQVGQYLARRHAAQDLELAHAELSQRAAELERSNADLEQFAYVASHDLAEPLRSIAGFTQLLERRYGDSLDSDATEFVGFIVDGVSRMQSLIDDLLLYSRVGRSETDLSDVDCGAIVDQALRSLAAPIEESGAKVTVGDLPVVRGRPRELGQLFSNLISNAVKFHDEGELPEVAISATAAGEGGWLIAVSDNGIGIEERHAERIFKMFQRLHARDEYVGTGIGLALCRKVVESHGGRIEVESTPGAGSTFSFTIPEGAAGP